MSSGGEDWCSGRTTGGQSDESTNLALLALWRLCLCLQAVADTHVQTDTMTDNVLDTSECPSNIDIIIIAQGLRKERLIHRSMPQSPRPNSLAISAP